MQCDRCGQREATHHDLVVNGSDVHETHLCEECARELGAASEPPGSVEWLTQFVLTPHPVKPGGQPVILRCDHCGLSFSQFKKSGLMGCPACYEAFEHKLVPLLERAHEGHNRHCGKVPRRALSRSRLPGEPVEPAAVVGGRSLGERIEALRRELADAVQSEAYEKAARIRDELYDLTQPDRSEGGGS